MRHRQTFERFDEKSQTTYSHSWLLWSSFVQSTDSAFPIHTMYNIFFYYVVGVYSTAAHVICKSDDFGRFHTATHISFAWCVFSSLHRSLELFFNGLLGKLLSYCYFQFDIVCMCRALLSLILFGFCVELTCFCLFTLMHNKSNMWTIANRMMEK